MSIVSNSGYNSPEIAAAAQNIASMFAPPTGSELAAYSVARKNNQQADIVAQLKANPEYQSFDHQAILGDLYDWTGSERKILMDDSTTRRGQDVSAATSRANNLLDNQTRLALPMISPRDPTHSAAGITPELADFFAMPEVAGFEGTPAPLTFTQWQAGEAQRLRDAGKLTDDDVIDVITKRDGDGSAREEQIERLKQNFLATGAFASSDDAYNAAVGIADGRYHMSSDPITGEVLITDLATRRPVGPVAGAPPANTVPAPNTQVGDMPAFVATGDPVIDAVMAPAAGQTRPGPTIAAAEARQYSAPYPATDKAFGVEGWAAGGLNRVADGLGMTVPYPETQQTQADFNVLRENLLNAVQEAYGRQPPSWLMQRLDQLTPDVGNPLEGAGQGRAELESLGRAFANDLQSAQAALETRLTPSEQMTQEARVRGLERALGEIDVVLQSFPGTPPTGGASPAAVPDADGWVTAPNGARIREVL